MSRALYRLLREERGSARFHSTHCYPNDPYKMLGFPEQPPLSETVYLVAKKIRSQVENSRMPELPVFFTEYNAGFGGKHRLDGPYICAWMANNIRLCEGAGLLDVHRRHV